jgi:ADP-L-glycero-D-manno-heptose 6-epimerase
MIIVTGAAGFIGSVMAGRLNRDGFTDLILVDDFSRDYKKANFEGKQYSALVGRAEFFPWLDKNHRFVEYIIHMGARTDTTEFDVNIFNHLNLNYSKSIWEACVNYGLPLIYASSAATYGSGDQGYEDDHQLVENLQPLNPYGRSKNDFDRWALQQEKRPFFWAGLKLFNVYGPNEYHKGRMASVIYHAFQQISKTGKMKLFRSHNPDYGDGEQMRDFVYVKDAVEVILYMMKTRKHSGLFNLGTGKARTFLDLVGSTFLAMGRELQIEFIDTPKDIRDKYQYFTEARMEKLRAAGYRDAFTSLEDGIVDYVKNYLLGGPRYY